MRRHVKMKRAEAWQATEHGPAFIRSSGTAPRFPRVLRSRRVNGQRRNAPREIQMCRCRRCAARREHQTRGRPPDRYGNTPATTPIRSVRSPVGPRARADLRKLLQHGHGERGSKRVAPPLLALPCPPCARAVPAVPHRTAERTRAAEGLSHVHRSSGGPSFSG